jgi:hypothetical protein
MAVAYRQPTFKNPLPTIFKWIASVAMGIFVGMIAMGEQAGRSRAAAELARQGYMDEARAIMLGKSVEDVKDV